MRLAKALLVAFGALILVVALALTGAGASLLWANATQRDVGGYFNTSYQTFESSGSAIVSSVDLTMHPGPSDWLSYRPLGTVRVRAEVRDASTFVGVARSADLDRYLSGVAYDQVRSVRVLPFSAHYRTFTGTRVPASPATQGFWAASATGRGVQEVTWSPEPGSWSIVVMRSDGGPGVVARASVGTNTGLVGPLGAVLLGAGVLALLGGGLMLGLGVIGLGRTRSRRAGADGPEEVDAPPAPLARGASAVRLDGRLEAPNRWKWLFKWILVVPHVIVLSFLWLAVIPLTLVAGISILVTGRYPRSIFDFTLGVVRWTWRVAFYSYSALATDRYPRFSLDRDDRYPASFDVEYPERLSRGLVLVKWLLAVPHFIIVGIFVGGGVGFAGRIASNWSYASGGGVIGLLVVVAGFVLLFTGRYPEAIFDFVMGLNRWCYRVLAYVLLLRDEYPPFRFDSGGVDPGTSARALAPVPGPDSPVLHEVD